MRISDWSSDVCSSDLAKPVSLAHKPRKSIDIVPFERAADPYLGRGGIGDHDRLFIVAVELGRGLAQCRLVDAADAVAPRQDRKTVVSGQTLPAPAAPAGRPPPTHNNHPPPPPTPPPHPPPPHPTP